MRPDYDSELLDRILQFLETQKTEGDFVQINSNEMNESEFGGDLDTAVLQYHLDYLYSEKLIKAVATKDGYEVKLLPKGEIYLKNGGLSRGEKRKREKEEKLGRHLDLQIQDLENRLKAMDDQLAFWRNTAEANRKKAKIAWPSFWISVGSLAVAIIALIKSCT